MGYTTEFEGSISIDPPLNPSEISFLTDLANTRRMNRTAGPLFVEGEGFRGQEHGGDVINSNEPHPDQPSLWLQWIPSGDGSDLEWDGGEKFYSSAEWMKYLVENLLAPSAQGYVARHANEDPRLMHFTFNHVLEGQIVATGEEPGDVWLLDVSNNKVSVARQVPKWGPLEEV